LAAAITAGCKNTKSTAEPAATSNSGEMTQRTNSIAPPVRMKELQEFDSGDPYTLQSASIKGDMMTLVVTYGGGCKEHSFVLFADPRIMKSMPPQQNILLHHFANEDHCRALITDTLRYDLSPLRSGKEGTVVLRLHDHKDRITYTYK
jgi:hypothetical protein